MLGRLSISLQLVAGVDSSNVKLIIDLPTTLDRRRHSPFQQNYAAFNGLLVARP